MVYEMKVVDVMTSRVLTVHPDDPMSSLREILRRNRISGLPVVEGDRLAGLISVEDYITWLCGRQEDCPIRTRMTPNVHTVCADEPLVLAVSQFEKSGVGRFPVVDRTTKELVGIVTKGDVIAGLLKKLEIDYQAEQLRRHRASYIFEDIEADATTILFQYDVPGHDFEAAGRTSSRLKKTLKRLGVRPDVVRRVAIASYEAEMNLVVFTEGGRIRARVQPRAVYVEVEDKGPGIADIKQAMEPGFSTAPDSVRELGFGAGMGLCNIQRSSDIFEIQSEPGRGTILKASFVIDEGHNEAR
jgi:CBS domain-containing protein/anti-sigma regulatory factor (Ser/Thr protein kinase)